LKAFLWIRIDIDGFKGGSNGNKQGEKAGH